MNDFQSYTISRTGKLYRLYSWFSTFFLTSWLITRDNWSEELDCFYSLCAFLRTSLFLFSYLGCLIVSLIYLLLNLTTPFDLVMLSNNYFAIFGTFFKYIYPPFLIVGLFSYWSLTNLSAAYAKRKSIQRECDKSKPKEEKKPNVWIQAVKDRHNNICRSFKIND